MQLLKTDGGSNKPQRPASVPPAASPPPSPDAVRATPPVKGTSTPPSAPQTPQAAPAEAGVVLKEHEPPLVEGTGSKEEYGYIFTNDRSAPTQTKYYANERGVVLKFCCSYQLCFVLVSSLTLIDGVKLLELLADKIHLTTRSFINIR